MTKQLEFFLSVHVMKGCPLVVSPFTSTLLSLKWLCGW